MNNIVIDASAGSGKTYQLEMCLAGRFFSGARPEETAAMTFSVAAAAEIYQRLLELLCGAATDEKSLAELKKGIADFGFPTSRISRESAAALLKHLVRARNELPIGTLDSFFYRIIQMFPIELGLPGSGASIIADAEGERLKLAVLGRLFSRDSRADIIEVCREAMYGNEKKQLLPVIDERLNDLEGESDRLTGPEAWNYWTGFEPTISPEAAQAAFKVCEKYRAELAKDRGINTRESLVDGLEKCAFMTEETRLSAREKTLIKLLLEQLDALGIDGAKLVNYTRIDFPMELRQAIKVLIMRAGELMVVQAARRTRGIGRLYAGYRAGWSHLAFGQGKLTFGDMPRLLNGHNENDYLYDIDYRMNARLKHWLLDEFQDTSLVQYEVLTSIIDELDGERSLFVVGDVKQAIYSWRGGDSALMEQMSRAYGLERRQLNVSRRYGENICSGLNRVFDVGNFQRLSELFPIVAPVCSDWGERFRAHRSATGNNDRFLSFWRCPDPDDKENSATFESDAARLIAKCLRDFGDARRRMSCAVLVRREKTARAIVEAMTEIDPELASEMIWEGDESIAGDRMIAAITAWLVRLQHPGNTAAATAAAMHPETRRWFGTALDGDGGRDLLSRTGVAATVGQLAENLSDAGKDNPNIEALLAAAREFAKTDRAPDMLDFRDFVGHYRQGEGVLSGKIRMMTVHHSKGRGFDAVFNIVDSDKPNFGNPDFSGFVVSEKGDFVIHNPGLAVYAAPELMSAALSEHRRRVSEEFCILYVGMTRAKKFLCNIAGGSKEKIRKFLKKGRMPGGNVSFYVGDFLADALWGTDGAPPVPETVAGVQVLKYSQGSFIPEEKTASIPGAEPMKLLSGDKLERFVRRMPSRSGAERLYYDLPESGRGAELGERIHDYFARHPFLDPNDVPSDPAVRRHVQACLASPEAMALLGRQPGVEVWSEQPFELIVPDKKGGQTVWLSGRFDRVRFVLDADGKFLSAAIIDFKSNYLVAGADLELAAEPYLEQMREYGEALERLTGLAQERIGKYLLFTGLGALFEVR